jgi:hypothetical protein
MHLPADAVADKAFYGGEAVVVHKLGHFSRDLAPVTLRVHKLEREVECCHCDIEQSLN